jgi:hypothetical protein
MMVEGIRSMAGLVGLVIVSASLAVAQEIPVEAPALPPRAASPRPAPAPNASEFNVRILPPEPLAYSFALHNRQACVTPFSRKLARADGGSIDVQTPPTGGLNVTMTGSAAANSYLGCTGEAAETCQLIQDFEVTSSDSAVRTVVLTLDTSLVGFVRSKGRAGAAVRRADVGVIPAGWDTPPLSQAYPCLSAEGTQGRLCNQHLPPVESPPLPVGRYTLVANLILDARASGVCDAHSVADFSPDTSLPPDWIRTRDPFQNVSKRAFGFSITLSASTTPSPGQSSASTRVTLPMRITTAASPR